MVRQIRAKAFGKTRLCTLILIHSIATDTLLRCTLKPFTTWLAGTPYEHIIVLVNTENYGGGGILNSYNLSMVRHSAFKPVVVHEFGHSLQDLAMSMATTIYLCIRTI